MIIQIKCARRQVAKGGEQMKTTRWMGVLAKLIILVIVVSACAAPTPVSVKETVVAPPVATATPAPVSATAAPPPTTVPAAPATSSILTPFKSVACGKTGGTLVLATTSSPPSLDSHVNMLRAVNVVTFSVYDPLFFLDERDRTISPALATDYKYEDDKTLLITLREGVKFHNGAPFTADDVKYTIERIQDPKLSSYMLTWLEPIDKVEVVDPMHVRLHLKHVVPGLVELLTRPQIYSKSAEATINTKPIGTGPFKFVEFKQNDSIIVEKNPDYWDKGYPCLDGVTFKILENADTRLNNLLAGTVDLVLDVDPKDWSRLKDDPKVTSGIPNFADTMEWSYLNDRRPPFNNIYARQALAYAFDSKTYLEKAYYGLAVYNRSIFAPGHWAHNPATENAYPHDMQKAAELLVKAGYPGGKGMKVDILAPVGYPTWIMGSEIMQAALTELGVEAKVETVDLAQYGNRLVTTYDYDVGWDFPNFSASEPTIFFGIPWTHVMNPKNIVGLDLPEYQKLIDEAGQIMDQDKRKALYLQADQLYTDAVPGITHGNQKRPMLWQPYVKNFYVPYTDLVNFRDVWLEK
jgi:peptide/nickel transport system substrate-binding protein